MHQGPPGSEPAGAALRAVQGGGLRLSTFARYIGIDYSGAETPNASLKGLRVYLAEGNRPPVEVLPPPSPRKYWTRRGIAEWLTERLAEHPPTLGGDRALQAGGWPPHQSSPKS
jgi:hypothetical protein